MRPASQSACRACFLCLHAPRGKEGVGWLSIFLFCVLLAMCYCNTVDFL